MNGTAVTNTGDMINGEYYHIAIVHGETAMTFYLNGVILPAYTFTNKNNPVTYSNTNITLGNGDGGSGGQGYIDDFRIYNKALTSTEVKAVYGHTITRIAYDDLSKAPSPYSYYWSGLTSDSGDNAYIEATVSPTNIRDIL